MHYLLYVLKWALILSLPVLVVWFLFDLAFFIPENLWWARPLLVWGAIWTPLVILAALADYTRSQPQK